MSNIELRVANAGDAAAIHGVVLAAFEPLRHRYTEAAFDSTVLDPERIVARMTDGPIVVAELAGHIVGTFGVRIDAGDCYLRGMGVAPSARGLGIARLLLHEVIAHAKGVPATRIWLYTATFLAPAISLYANAGFVPFDEDAPTSLFGTPVLGMELPAS